MSSRDDIRQEEGKNSNNNDKEKEKAGEKIQDNQKIGKICIKEIEKTNKEEINEVKEEINEVKEEKEKEIVKKNELKEDKNNKEKLIEFKKMDNILELNKKTKSTEFFLLKKKRLLELNNSRSFHNLDLKKNKTNVNNSKSFKNSENSNNNENEYNDYNSSQSVDYVEEEQTNILEEMFIEAKNSEDENKINLFLEIIDLDETKEKIYSYKCYGEICSLYIEFEEHEKFMIYYIKLREIAHLIEEKKMRTYVKFTTEEFVKRLSTKKKESINHWLEDISKDFNINQQDKVINAFEANINLNFLLLANKIKQQANKDDKNNNDYETQIDINVIDYMQDKQKLEELTTEYLIKECGYDPKYLDSKGNTFFYYQPLNSLRGGEQYNVPIGWIGFGLEVLNRYGNDSWLGNDGKEGEWAVAYHGFGKSYSGNDLKNLIKTIVHDNLRPGGGQACCGNNDKRHPGKKCGNGVYITPNINVAHGYAGFLPLGSKTYNIIIMVRVNTKYIREPENAQDYWIVDGDSNQLRPYRLLIKENEFNRRYY